LISKLAIVFVRPIGNSFARLVFIHGVTKVATFVSYCKCTPKVHVLVQILRNFEHLTLGIGPRVDEILEPFLDGLTQCDVAKSTWQQDIKVNCFGHLVLSKRSCS
jgi:hypothetical protein